MPVLTDQGIAPEGWDVPDPLKPVPAPPPPTKPVYNFTDPYGSPPATAPAWKAADLTSRFGHVDTMANRTLPTSHVLALGESNLQDADLARAARMLARQYDLDPGWFFSPYQGTGDVFLAPNGDVITGTQARTILKPQEPQVLLSMLQKIAGPDQRIDVMPPGRKREQFSYSRPSVQTTAKVIDALVSSHVADQMSLATVLGVGAQVASRLDGVKNGAATFAANMQMLRGQSAGHWSVLVGIAEDGAAKGDTFASPAAALSKYGTPGVAGTTGGMDPAEFKRRVRESSLQQIPLRTYNGTIYFFDPVGQKWIVTPKDVAEEYSSGRGTVFKLEPVRMTTSPDTWGMPVNTPTSYGGDGVYRPPNIEQVAAAGFLPNIGGFDMRRTQDYYKQARQMAHQAVIDKSAYDHSFLGWTMNRIGDGANFVYRYTEAGALRIAQLGAYPINYALGGHDEASRRFWQDEHSIDAIKHGQETLGGLVADSLHLPPAAGAAIELAFATGADPFMLGGRLIKGLRAGRSLVELGEVERGGALSRLATRVTGRQSEVSARIARRWQESVGEALLKPRRLWDGKSLVRFATETAWDSKRPLYNVVSERARTLLRVEGMDPELARKVEQVVTIAKRGGMTIDQAEPVVRDLFAAGLGAKPLSGSVLSDMLSQLDRLQADRITQVSTLAGTLKLSEPEVLKALNAEFDLYDRTAAHAMLSEVEHSFTNGRVLQFELPYRSGTMNARMAVNRIGGDTYLGRGVRALTTRIPTPLTEFEAGQYAEQLDRKLRRSRVFQQSEIEAITKKARQLSEATNPYREHTMVRLLDQVQKETWDRLTLEYGLPKNASRDLYAKLTEQIDRANAGNAENYGVKFSRDPVSGEIAMTASERPLYETQLLNGYYTADPIQMRKAVRDAIGFRKTLENALGRLNPIRFPEEELTLAKMAEGAQRNEFLDRLTAKKKIPESEVRGKPGLGSWLDSSWQWLAHDHFLRYWKAGQVIRPGYIFRVAGGDEQIRALLDIGLASRVRSQAILGHAAENLADRGLLPRGWIESHVSLPTADGAGYDVTFRIPGALPNEAYANSHAAFGQVWESLAEQMRQISKGVEKQSWGVVEPKDGLKKWARAWDRAVNGQLAHGSVGRMALEDVAAGRSAAESAARIEDYLTNDRLGQAVVKRMQYDPTEVPDWVAEAVATARRYVMEDPRVAEAALRGAADPAMIRGLVENTDQLPPVHGLKAEIVAGKSNPIKPVVDTYARWILQEPTNHLSRQPFFKAWFDRVLRAQVNLAVQSGVVYKDAAEAEHALAAMEAQARRFAIDRVRKVMFDLRDQSRLAELLGFVSPFFQPFQEAFSVYGHLLRRNPALVGWARVVWKALTESGFVQKDDTGHYVVPLTVFGKMAGLLTATGFHDGFHLTAPLTSFNLFFNNAFPIPTGKLAGSLSIPMPGLSPPLMWLAQHFISDEGASRLSQWAFQYGPLGVSSLLPTWLNNAVTAVDPSWNQNGYTAYVEDFQRLNQALGVKFASTEDAVATAESQAKSFYRWKAGISLVSPAGPSIKFPTQALEDEFQHLVQTYTAKGKTWTDARDEFLKRHPDDWLITIGKTMWQRPDPGLPSTITAPSIPANELADKILSQPGFKDFAQQYPAMAFALLPQAAFASPDYSPDVFRKQLAAAARRYRTPTEFATAGEAAAGWSAYWHLRDGWDAWRAANDTVPENSIEYQTHKDEYDSAVTDLRTRYPAFDDAYGVGAESGMDPRVMGYMRAVAENPVLADFPVGKALKQYLAGRDAIEKQMAAKGVTTVTSVSADQAGIAKRYTALVAGLEKRYPDFARVYDTFLSNDLMGVHAAGDTALDSLDPATRSRVTSWEAQMNSLRDQIDLAPTDLERAKLYGKEAEWINSAYRDYPAGQNPVALWFHAQDYQTRKRITSSVQTKPYVFLNRYERTEVLHEPTNDFAEQTWQQVADARTQIEQRAAIDPNFNSSSAYAALDVYVQSAAKSDPVFAQQVNHANEWGWAFWNHNPDATQAGPAGDAWRNLHNATQQIEVWAVKNGLHGTVGSKEQEVQWNRIKSAVLDYVNQLGSWSSTFKRQWQEIDSSYSGNLIDVFIPDVFFPLGAGAK